MMLIMPLTLMHMSINGHYDYCEYGGGGVMVFGHRQESQWWR